jgi:integrase
VSTLHRAVDEYLAVRRALGFRLTAYGTVLHDCVAFIEREGKGVITTDLLLRWATRRADVSRAWWCHQLGVSRGFARYWSARDARTEVPPLGLLPTKRKRRKPYLYTDDEIARVIRAASTIRSRSPLWPRTMATLIGLLSVTGMRIGEALALDDDDFHRDDMVLTVRCAKFGKSRLIPLHPTTCAALRKYAVQRSRLHGSSSEAPFFPSPTGKRLLYGQVHWTFGLLLERAGLPGSLNRS